MSDLSSAIQPKVDQLTADDLIAGPITIRISGVSVAATADQPVAISFDGDGGRPWKPCKSMTRVLVHLWGADSSTFVGRSATLYRDPAVLWGGMKVGGVRISHLSDIKGSQTLALTATKGNKKPYTVKPLAAAPAAAETTPEEIAATLVGWFDEAEDADAHRAITGDANAKKQVAFLIEHYPALAQDVEAARLGSLKRNGLAMPSAA